MYYSGYLSASLLGHSSIGSLDGTLYPLRLGAFGGLFYLGCRLVGGLLLRYVSY